MIYHKKQPKKALFYLALLLLTTLQFRPVAATKELEARPLGAYRTLDDVSLLAFFKFKFRKAWQQGIWGKAKVMVLVLVLVVVCIWAISFILKIINCFKGANKIHKRHECCVFCYRGSYGTTHHAKGWRATCYHAITVSGLDFWRLDDKYRGDIWHKDDGPYVKQTNEDPEGEKTDDEEEN